MSQPFSRGMRRAGTGVPGKLGEGGPVRNSGTTGLALAGKETPVSPASVHIIAPLATGMVASSGIQPISSS